MSAGEAIDKAHTSAARAVGLLSLMIAKRRLSRENLETALYLFDEATNAIRGVLTPNGDRDRVGASAPDQGDNDGTDNPRG